VMGYGPGVRKSRWRRRIAAVDDKIPTPKPRWFYGDDQLASDALTCLPQLSAMEHKLATLFEGSSVGS
jgi:hypothetical protein